MKDSRYLGECTIETAAEVVANLKSESLWDRGFKPVWLQAVSHQPAIKQHPVLSRPIFISIGKRFNVAAQVPQSHLDFMLWLTRFGHTVTTQGKRVGGSGALDSRIPLNNSHTVTARLDFRDRPESMSIRLDTLFPDLPVSGSALPRTLDPADPANWPLLDAQQQAWEFAIKEALRLYDEREFGGTLGEESDISRSDYAGVLEDHLWWVMAERAAYFDQIPAA